MSYIIGDLGYTSSACSDLIKLIRQISETGNLEDFVRFQEELDLAISNRDSLSDKEREIVAEIMSGDEYFKELGTGDYLYTLGDFSDYVDNALESEGYSNKYCDKEFLKNIFLEGLVELEDYIKDEVEQTKFEADEREDIIKEYERLTTHNPFKRI